LDKYHRDLNPILGKIDLNFKILFYFLIFNAETQNIYSALQKLKMIYTQNKSIGQFDQYNKYIIMNSVNFTYE